MAKMEQQGYNLDVYRTAKSTRPAWANALIVAAVIFLAAIVVTITSGLSGGVWAFGAVAVTLVIAGVLALTKMKN
jgi:hypothetical protein